MTNGELESKGSNTYSGPRIKCSENLVRFWRDLHDDQTWKYEELCPIDLLEKVEIDHRTVPKDELDRIAWFWRRRPRGLTTAGLILWLIAAVAAPFCVIVPCLALPILVTSMALLLWTIVRSVRWRREYESSVSRLLHTR
ncbi:MAG: hypothetical protein JO275_04615 [Verrucomicrobia bacterium]|nr:hypothetical protein [Verrucomicrobiota bacterium]